MEGLDKLKLDSLRILGDYMSIPNVDTLNKKDLIMLINQQIVDAMDQRGGTEYDNCSYPCPKSTTGNHRFKARGSGYNPYSETETLWECQHCGCIKRE